MKDKRFPAKRNNHSKTKTQFNQTSMFPDNTEDESLTDNDLPTEPIIIQRDVTIDKITEYYYDLVESFKNGDPRIKATDYIKALSEIARLNNLYSQDTNTNKPTTISFTLG